MEHGKLLFLDGFSHMTGNTSVLRRNHHYVSTTAKVYQVGKRCHPVQPYITNLLISERKHFFQHVFLKYELQYGHNFTDAKPALRVIVLFDLPGLSSFLSSTESEHCQKKMK